MLKRMLLVVLLAALPRLAFAQNGLTVGTTTLTTTLKSISVAVTWTGDANANATLLVEYQKHTGDTGYHTAYTPYLDRRATIGGQSNSHNLEARVGIVGLIANTSYDVRTTWTDADGVTGTNPVVTTLSTLTSTPPTGSGTTRNVTDNTTQASALAAAVAGDTLNWSAGSYNAFTLSASGNSGAWIILDGGGVATINGAGVNQNILVSANFVIVRNFILSASDFNALVTSSNNHDIILQGNTVQAFSHLCANGPRTTHYGDTGIAIGTGASNVFVLSNTITGDVNLGNSCIQSPTYDGPGTGIGFQNCTTCIFDSNTIACNGCRDALSSDSSNNAIANVDISNNTVSGFLDDGIEFKGTNLNVRAWGNVVTAEGYSTTGPNTCWSNESTLGTNTYGPSYYFRATCVATKNAGGNAAYKGPAGPTYIFHTSLNTTGATQWGNWTPDSGGGSNWPSAYGPLFVLNNAAKVTNSMTEHAGEITSTFDYNCGTTPGTYAYKWDNVNSYSTFASFKSATSQETHGVSADPNYDQTLHLNTGSPCIDVGVSINNFNTSDSAWPSSGSAPDAGAFEYSAPAPPSTSKPTLRMLHRDRSLVKENR